jgi:hypothetical protein
MQSAGALLAAAIVLLPSATLHAHSAPGVASIVDEDADGIYVLRLYQGHAQRGPDGWHYFCSGLYRGQGFELSAALPGGGVAIAAPEGLWVLKRDGTLGPHPDRMAKGLVTAFARGGGKLYAVKQRPDETMYDVVEITADAVRVIWSDSRYWTDLAVGNSLLQLVRTEEDKLEELQLSLDGQVLRQQHAMLANVLALNTHMIGDETYYTARLESSLELGHIDQNSWHMLQTAHASIAGPSRTADGTSFIALDGKLSIFNGDVLMPSADTTFVARLDRLDAHSYACTNTGLRSLSSAGLGESLFDLSQMLPPDPCVVPQNLRSTCNLEWQHLIVELLGSNISVAASSAPSGCVVGASAAATGAADASSGGSAVAGAGTDAGARGSWAASDGSAVTEAEASPKTPIVMTPAASDGGGCGVCSTRCHSSVWITFVLAPLYALRRRGSKRTARSQ